MPTFYHFAHISRRIICQRPALVCRLLLCLCPCLLFGELAYAEKNIVVISSSNATVYQQAYTAFEEDLERRGLLETYTLNRFQLGDINKTALFEVKGTASVLTIGSAAASYAIQHYVDTPIICTFITRNAFTSIAAKFPLKKNLSAVFIDQSLSRLLNLASLLGVKQSALKVGMLNQNPLELDKSTGNGRFLGGNIEVKSASLQKNDNPMKVIEALMMTSDIVIVRPNTSLFNRLVAKLVLQLSMRHKTPVIGFSKKYAQAGALLSVYASPEDIGMDAAKTLNNWLPLAGHTMPESKEGSNFSIVVNHHVAKKMGITPNAKELKNELQKMEGK